MQKIVSVIDDDIDISRLFYEVLTENIIGVDVFSFNDPILALEHFEEKKSAYALVISDIRMPGLPGTELVRKLKIMNPLVRRILMTAFAINDIYLKSMLKRT